MIQAKQSTHGDCRLTGRSDCGKGAIWTVWVVVGIIVSVAIGASFLQEIHRRVLVRQQIDEIRKEIENREQRIVHLRQLTEYLQTDAYLERAAREKLGYQKPGEQVVVVPPGEKVLSETIEQTVRQTVEPPSVPRQWWDLYFGGGKEG
jgi:cell division protein FtsB